MLLQKFSHILVDFPCSHIFLLFSCFVFLLLDLQPDLTGLGGIIAVHTVQSFILDYQCSLTQEKEYFMKKRKLAQKDACCLAQFVPPRKITNFSCSSTDLGRWSVTCLCLQSSMWLMSLARTFLGALNQRRLKNFKERLRYIINCGVCCTMACFGLLLVGSEVLRNRITSLSDVEEFGLFHHFLNTRLT